MWWMVGLVFMALLGRALAQDSRGSTEQLEVENAKRAADWAIVRFNTEIQDYPSWKVFKITVLSQVAPGTLGTCYAYRPTVSLDVISLVASSYGYYRGQIEQPAAH